MTKLVHKICKEKIKLCIYMHDAKQAKQHHDNIMKYICVVDAFSLEVVWLGAT